MTHTPEFNLTVDDFDCNINPEEFEPMDYNEREMIIRSFFEDEVVIENEVW